MKLAITDVGSNSVRLMIWVDGKTLYKRINTTRLGENLAQTGKILPQAIERTVKVIKEFKDFAVNVEGCDEFYAFATAAVRSASNRDEFLKSARSQGIEVDVISGEVEAKLGMYGVLSCFPENRKGYYSGIIDVGGASTEMTLQTENNIVYSKSLDIGVVRLYDLAKRDKYKLIEIIDKKIEEYGEPFEKGCENVCIYGIGGTATTIASTLQKLPVYDPLKVNGYVFTYEQLESLSNDILSKTVDEVKAMLGMEPKRADVIGGGALIILRIMKKFGIKSITVSESDNLEGYALYTVGGIK